MNKIKKIWTIGGLALAMLLLASCSKAKDSTEIEKTFRKEFSHVNFKLLERIDMENASDPGQIRALITAKDLDDNFSFSIYSIIIENAGLGKIESFDTDYLGKKLQFVLDGYKNYSSLFKIRLGDKYRKGTINLDFTYTDKNSLDQKIEALKDFLLHAFEKEPKMSLTANAIFDITTLDNAADQANPAPTTFKIEGNPAEKIDELKSKAFMQYAINSRALLLSNNDFPMTMIENASKSDLNTYAKFKVTNADNTFFFKDLLANRQDVLHYRVLFEILKRTGYQSLEGDKSAFTFTGKDGRKYEFSDKFNDATISKNPKHPHNGKPANYYLIDGQEAFFTTPYLRYLTFDKLKDMTGYEFEIVEE